MGKHKKKKKFKVKKKFSAKSGFTHNGKASSL
jgi:hypothetical protein